MNLNRFEEPTKDGLDYAPPSKLMRTLNPDDKRTKALTSAQSKKRATNFKPPKTPQNGAEVTKDRAGKMRDQFFGAKKAKSKTGSKVLTKQSSQERILSK